MLRHYNCFSSRTQALTRIAVAVGNMCQFFLDKKTSKILARIGRIKIIKLINEKTSQSIGNWEKKPRDS